MEERKPLIPVKELAKRYALFIISLFISALGVAISTIIAAENTLTVGFEDGANYRQLTIPIDRSHIEE